MAGSMKLGKQERGGRRDCGTEQRLAQQNVHGSLWCLAMLVPVPGRWV